MFSMFDEKSTDTYFFIGGIQEEIEKEEYEDDYDEYIDNDYEYYDDLAYYYDSIIDDYNDY